MSRSNILKPSNILIGITGPFGSGKSTTACFLAKKGFISVQLSEFLEQECLRRGSNITRQNLQDIGNEWRVRLGAHVLAQKAWEKVQKNNWQRVVIDGIRNVGEIEYLQTHGNFQLVAIVSDRSVRFERLKKNKLKEQLSWEVFTRLDYRDLGLGEEKTGLQGALCIGLADYYCENNTTQEEFMRKLTILSEKIVAL